MLVWSGGSPSDVHKFSSWSRSASLSWKIVWMVPSAHSEVAKVSQKVQKRLYLSLSAFTATFFKTLQNLSLTKTNLFLRKVNTSNSAGSGKCQIEIKPLPVLLKSVNLSIEISSYKIFWPASLTVASVVIYLYHRCPSNEQRWESEQKLLANEIKDS